MTNGRSKLSLNRPHCNGSGMGGEKAAVGT